MKLRMRLGAVVLTKVSQSLLGWAEGLVSTSTVSPFFSL